MSKNIISSSFIKRQFTSNNKMEYVYKIFLYKKSSNELLWEFYHNNLEFIAGMLAVSIGVLDDINSRLSFENYYIDSNVDVSKFRVLNHIFINFVKNYSKDVIKIGYGIWLRSIEPLYYNLYNFFSLSFIHGMISFCISFNVDVRDYIYDLPFDSHGINYDLDHYPLNKDYKIYVTYDLDDIEEEEEDDENIIEPLKRSDEIIVLKD